MSRRQRATVTVLPALLLAAIVVPMTLAWGELPDSIATHWDLGGTPNGHMPPMVLLLVMGGIFTAMWSAVWFSSRRMPFEARSFITGLAAVGGLLATITWFTVEANRGASDWTAAGRLTGVHILLAFVATVVSGVVAWLAAGDSPQPHTRQAPGGPMLQLEPGTTRVWASRGRGYLIVAVGILLVGVAVVMWSVASIVLVAVAVPVFLFSEVRVTVGQGGVVVSLGWLGIPSWTVPLQAIETADVEQVNPMSYGGWGYRVRPGTRAIVVRRGPALRLRRFDRPDLVLTVDDPAQGAGLVNALVS